MWCMYVCVCAPAEKGEGVLHGQRPLQRPLQRGRGRQRGDAPSTGARHKMHGAAGTARRAGAHTCVSQGTPAAPSEERTRHGGMHTQHAGGTQNTQDGRARNRRPPAPRAAPQRALPPAWDGAPCLLTSRHALLCTHGSQRTPEGGAHASAPTRAPRPVRRPAPPGPPGSPARGGPDAHTVTTADGLSDEEERGVTYAWL